MKHHVPLSTESAIRVFASRAHRDMCRASPPSSESTYESGGEICSGERKSVAPLQDILQENQAKICLVKDGGLKLKIHSTLLVYSKLPPL